MQAVNDQIEALGATVAALTLQIAKKNQEMIDKNELFDLLHDAGNTYADKSVCALRCRRLSRIFMTSSVSTCRVAIATTAEPLPMPGRSVIDQGGIVAVDVDPDYTRQPEPEKDD